MSDDRNTYKGQVITLELHSSDVSGGVISSVDRVIIMQDKEVCFTTTAITLISPDTWSITLNTNDVLYSGDYHDRWIIDGGSSWVDKSLTISSLSTNIPARSSGNYVYYSKDIYWEVKPDGDIYRLYNENSIASAIESICMTIMGSLFNEPTYGTNLYRFLFSNSSTIITDIKADLQTQIQLQMPNIKVSNVIVVALDTTSYQVKIQFYNIVSSNPTELLSMTNVVSIENVK